MLSFKKTVDIQIMASILCMNDIHSWEAFMLIVENLSKEYPLFKLNNISFQLPKGYIMGFIGMNGAGKTTTLKSMLNLVKPDSGTVTILGKDVADSEVEIKQEIGFMLGEADYYSKSKVKKIANVYKRFFKEWDEKAYQNYLTRFGVDESKMISELSSGMRVKLAIAFALSHKAKLLIFDEPTSGLDPIARDEMLDLFHEIVEDGEKSIIFSTHITSDLDKCADFIIFIRNGELIANTSKDDLIADHILVAGKKSDLTDELKNRLIGFKLNAFGFIGLMHKNNMLDTEKLQTEIPNLEDIMIYYNKEEQK